MKEMIELWWAEAERHGVLPLDDRGAALLFRAARRPGLPTSRNRFVYYPPISHIVADACPPANRGWTMTVDIEHPATDGDGALVARGSLNSGFALYIRQGAVHFDYNCFHEHTMIKAQQPLASGPHKLEVKIERLDRMAARVVLTIDSAIAGEGKIATLLRMLSSTGMDLGRSLSPVNSDYTAPFAYPGRIRSVVFEVPAAQEREAAAEAAAQARAAMTRQ